MLSENEWVRHLCPSASASLAGLPHLSGHAAHVCVPHDGTHGGLAIMPRFLSGAETKELTQLVERRFGLPAKRLSYNSSFESISIKPSWLSQSVFGGWSSRLPHIGARLRAFPGQSSALKRRPQHELLQIAVTGQRSTRARKASVHHDRNMGQHRVLTVLGYLGRQRPEGAHTLFPLFDVAGLGPREPHVHAALRLIRRAIASAPPREDSNDNRIHFTPAAELLCEATLKAAQEAKAPPVLAVPPTPGSAAIFWQYARGPGPNAPPIPEWTNWHIACAAHGERPKLAFQSFRVNMTLARPLAPPSPPPGRQPVPRSSVSTPRARIPWRGGIPVRLWRSRET